MKEKTFEELAFDESFKMSFGSENINMVKVRDVVTLMQQVREATIAECKEVLKDFNDGFGFEMLERNPLPTDRIKLTENKNQ